MLYASLHIGKNMNNLRVTMVQTRLHWEDIPANLQQFDEKLAPLAHQTDLVILPEMFTTGFSMNAAPLAEPMDGKTMQWLRAKAAALNAVVTGSFIAEEEGAYYNRLVWMRPDGSYETYDKSHLFTFADENRHYTPGKRRLVVDLHGWKILPLICYDLRFPVWSRNVEGYDLLIYVANFPELRRFAWTSLLTARAVENLAYTIGINRVGTDGNDISYSGDSTLLDFSGQTLYHVSHVENIFTATISYKAQQAFRQRFTFLNDRDSFTLH